MTLGPEHSESAEIRWQGRYIAVSTQGRWEYVSRVRNITAAAILAIDDGHILLVEQFRVPLDRRCLELPAGLVGDEDDEEAIDDAARRELEEETGYRAETIESLGEFSTSPGMASETFWLTRATGLTRINDGGGVVGDEDIVVHRVPLAAIAAFVAKKRAEGMAIDVKILLLLGPGLLAA